MNATAVRLQQILRLFGDQVKDRLLVQGGRHRSGGMDQRLRLFGALIGIRKQARVVDCHGGHRRNCLRPFQLLVRKGTIFLLDKKTHRTYGLVARDQRQPHEGMHPRIDPFRKGAWMVGVLVEQYGFPGLDEAPGKTLAFWRGLPL